MFTSPQDDHIDRAAYFERCFPTMDRLRRHELLHVTPTDGEDVFMLDEYELATGEVFRNAEVLTVLDGQIVEAQVFLGGRVDARRPSPLAGRLSSLSGQLRYMMIRHSLRGGSAGLARFDSTSVDSATGQNTSLRRTVTDEAGNTTSYAGEWPDSQGTLAQ